MPGGIPSGSDPGGYTPFPFSVVGAMLSGMQDRTEENVRAELEAQVQDNPTLTGFSNKVFSGINPALGLVAGIIEAMLRKIIGQIPVIGPVADSWVGELLDQLETFYTNLGGMLGSINFMDPDFNPAQAAQDFVELMLLPLNILLGPNSPINLANAFGNLTHVGIGAISASSPNLLGDGKFAPGSINDNEHWSVSVDHSRSPDGTGAAVVVCDGNFKSLRSGKTPANKIIVDEGQKILSRLFISHDALVCSGVAVRLQLIPFIDDVPQPAVDIDSYTPTTATVPWPGKELTGFWTVPEGSGINGFQKRILVMPECLSGTIYCDDAKDSQPSVFRMEWVDGLPQELQNALSRWQLLLDTVFNGITGADTFFNDLPSLLDALKNIPFANVMGVLGPENLGNTVIGILNAVVGGLVGQAGTGASIPDAFNIAKLISSMASQGANAWEILGIRNNKPVDSGLLPSSHSNFNITSINTSLTATQAASLISTFRIAESMPLGLISWLGCGTTGLTAFYVNVWKIDPANGTRTLVHHSPNIVGELVAGTTPNWEFYELATPLALVAGEDYAIELVPVGGSHTVRGMSRSDDIPDHPYAQVVGLAATRDNTSAPNSPPASIVKASWVTSGEIAWIEIAIDTGNNNNQHDPVLLYFNGSSSVPVPSWCNQIDAIGNGGGGGGRQGGTVFVYGEGGDAGKWNADTWVRGTDFTGDVTVTIDVGEGGEGGTGTGADGGDTVISIPGHSVTATGGDGGESFRVGIGRGTGWGPGQFVYNGREFEGGTDQEAVGGDGVAPGGGGNGGNWLTFSPGGRGADGGAWIWFLPGEPTEEPDDVTPPTAPTIIDLNSSTYSSLTVTAGGSTD